MRAAGIGGFGATAGAGATVPTRAFITTFVTFAYLSAVGSVGFSFTFQITSVLALAAVPAGVAFVFIGGVN